MSEALQNREVAFYYPNPMWANSDWIKNLILFFDGIALLVPNYMTDRVDRIDPAIVAGLREHNLLHIIEPEKAVDRAATQKLATMLTDIMASGFFDKLSDDGSAFAELSMSRMGFHGDEEIAKAILAELVSRKLAQPSEDGVSIPMHRRVRVLILVLLAQILAPYGANLGAELCPATDQTLLVRGLEELLTFSAKTSDAGVISFDMNTVGVDVSNFPIDEILDFRRQNYTQFQKYRDSIKLFASEISALPDDKRDIAFRMRQDELDALGSDLKKVSRNAWRKPAAFGLTLVGATVNATMGGNPILSALAAGAAALNYTPMSKPKLGAYSYVFQAARRFG